MNQAAVLKLLQQNEYNHSDPPPEEHIVFRIQFKRIGSLGDFILFSGRPKSGKTKYLSGCIAAAISRQEVFDMRIKLPDHKSGVVHFDTEQSKISHYRMMQLIMKLADTETFPQHFKSYRCRSVAPSQILAMVEHYLKINPQTGIVYLDGLLDVIDSMNDEKHSSFIKQWLKRITEDYGILLAGVIHRGFANDKSIGQIGSAGERAAQSVLIVEKDKEKKQYILKAEYLRDDDEFTPVAIHYSDQLNLWQQCEYIPDSDTVTQQTGIRRSMLKRRPNEYELSEHSLNVGRMFNTSHILTYENLIQQIVEVYAVGRQWAKDAVPVLCSENLIWKVEQGYTNKRQVNLYKTGIA